MCHDFDRLACPTVLDVCQLEFEVAIVNFVPRQSLLVELFHEWIWIKFLNIPNAWLLPKPEHEHACTNHGWNASCVADALHASFFIGCTV